MKKIFHLITTINRGGAENHLVSLVTHQVRQGYHVTIAYLKGDGYWGMPLQSLGIQVIDLGLRYYGDIKPVLKLRAAIRELRPSMIHAHLPPAELYTRLALLGISKEQLPLVISKHNNEPFFNGIGHRILGSWVAKRANRIIAISDSVRNYICCNVGSVPPQKITTIHYGIDPTLYENVDSSTIFKIRQQWSVDDETYLIGAVARLVPQKALDVLLEGFAIYLQQAKRPSKLVIVGSGPLENNLKKIAVRFGIEDCVIWAGFRKDIPVVINTFDLFALTSIYEGFGLVLLEAMAAARPIVATCVSAVPEIVEDDVTGKLIPSKQADSLASAFKFFENIETRRKFGMAGRQTAKIKFSLTKMVNKTTALYDECLGEANAPGIKEPPAYA